MRVRIATFGLALLTLSAGLPATRVTKLSTSGNRAELVKMLRAAAVK